MDPEKTKYVLETFWSQSDRRPKAFTPKDLAPSQLHNWGEITGIGKQSPTLSKLVKNGGLSGDIDMKTAFKTVMDELELKFEIITMNTFDESDHAVMYEVQSLPRWTFRGLGSSKEEALRMAAKNGLEFLTVMAS